MSETLYKWTDADGKTRAGEQNETQWGPGVEHAAPGGDLCTSGVIHAYRDPLLAVFMDPGQGGYTNKPGARLWRLDADVCADDGTKVGCTRVKMLCEIDPPTLSTDERTHAAILIARQVYADPDWQGWARRWLSGEDRATGAATWAATWAAEAAEAATWAATWAAEAPEAAWAAACAATEAAERQGHKLDFVALLHKAVADERALQAGKEVKDATDD